MASRPERNPGKSNRNAAEYLFGGPKCEDFAQMRGFCRSQRIANIVDCMRRESNPDWGAARAKQIPAAFLLSTQGVSEIALFRWWLEIVCLPPLLPQICHKFSKRWSLDPRQPREDD